MNLDIEKHSQTFLSNSNFPDLATPPKIVQTEMFKQGGARMASISILALHHGVVDQLGRSLPWHLFGKRLGFQIGRGREFKSRPLHIFIFVV